VSSDTSFIQSKTATSLPRVGTVPDMCLANKSIMEILIGTKMKYPKCLTTCWVHINLILICSTLCKLIRDTYQDSGGQQAYLTPWSKGINTSKYEGKDACAACSKNTGG
jgi:hypothetical protein